MAGAGMTTSIAVLEVRRALGRKHWTEPTPFGPDGWMLACPVKGQRVILTCDDSHGFELVHASISGQEMPSYADMVLLHLAVWGEKGYAYEVFAPKEMHVNIHDRARHLWGRLDGKALIPELSGQLPGVGRSI
jgi:hypothetical protein